MVVFAFNTHGAAVHTALPEFRRPDLKNAGFLLSPEHKVQSRRGSTFNALGTPFSHPRVARLSRYHRIDFNFREQVFLNQCRNLNQGCRWPDIREYFTLCLCNFLPPRYVGDKRPNPDNILQR